MRFVLEHPSDTPNRAEYGFCPRFGFWVELWRSGDCRPWLTHELGEPSYDSANPLRSALQFLAEHELLDAADIEVVLATHKSATPSRHRGTGRAAEVMRNFREASGE
jgi:hypothetical protein